MRTRACAHSAPPASSRRPRSPVSWITPESCPFTRWGCLPTTGSTSRCGSSRGALWTRSSPPSAIAGRAGTLTRALGVIQKVCEAMAFAHERGVIHRDLKPANVMVGRFGETYVMDWGLAKLVGRADTRDLRPTEASMQTILTSTRADDTDGEPGSPLTTMDGDVIGTPAYMAPEQALGRIDAVGPRSDVYSVGAMLYHLLAGQAPYTPPGAGLSVLTVLRAAVAGPPRAPRAARSRRALGAGGDRREGHVARGGGALRRHARHGRGHPGLHREPRRTRLRDRRGGRVPQVGGAQPRAGGHHRRGDPPGLRRG